MSISKVRFIKRYDRQLIQSMRDCLFVFGDNMIRVGYGGQAGAARDEPNAVGIVTKRLPSNTTESFLYDRDLDEVAPIIDRDFERLYQHNGLVYWPIDGIGTGLARLNETAPAIMQYIDSKLYMLHSMMLEEGE
jgi:hypothetical protein